MKATHTGNSHTKSAGIAAIHLMNMFDDITFITSTLRSCVTKRRGWRVQTSARTAPAASHDT
ncbi:MAG: hypothetical protein OSB41_08030 [Kiritimatiellae bacterium]|nr:hypothetical protein [Kiritimatiellia bacterium]